MLGHRFGNRRVQRAVQNSKVLRGDRHSLRGRDFHDRLADIAVIVHDLRETESSRQQLTPGPGGCRTDRGLGRRARDASRRRMSLSWSRKSGTPDSSSAGDATGYRRAATRRRAAATICSWDSVRKSLSMRHPQCVGHPARTCRAAALGETISVSSTAATKWSIPKRRGTRPFRHVRDVLSSQWTALFSTKHCVEGYRSVTRVALLGFALGTSCR